MTSRAPAARRILLPVEGRRWLVSMTGLFGDHAHRTLKGLSLAFARSLPVPDVCWGPQGATARPSGHKIPSSRWFYEQMERLPDGLLMLGDSVCALNPVTGGASPWQSSGRGWRPRYAKRIMGQATCAGCHGLSKSSSVKDHPPRLAAVHYPDLRYPGGRQARSPRASSRCNGCSRPWT